jgi:hypothetical protein
MSFHHSVISAAQTAGVIWVGIVIGIGIEMETGPASMIGLGDEERRQRAGQQRSAFENWLGMRWPSGAE